MNTGKIDKDSEVTTAGQAEARAFVEAGIPAEPLRPTLEMDRIQVLDPRHSPTLPPDVLRKKSTPRAPEQKERPEVLERITTPMERPATKMQVIKIDPEVLIELSRKKAVCDVNDANATHDAHRATLPTEPEKTPAQAPAGSPWAVAGAEIDRSALPSALAPSVRSVPAPAAAKEKAGNAAPHGEKRLRRGLVPVIGVMVGVVVAVAVVKVVPSAAVSGAAPEVSATVPRAAVVAVPVVASVTTAAAAAASIVAVPVMTAEVDAGARVVPGAANGVVPAPVKAKGSGTRNNDDPYDAAAPGAARTAEPVMAPSIPATVAPAPPPLPSAAPTAPPPATSAVPSKKLIEERPVF